MQGQICDILRPQLAMNRFEHSTYLQVSMPTSVYRCGVYCAANACIEQVIQHGEVDVFQAVKTVRRHRPQLVENLVRKSVVEQDFFPKNIYINVFVVHIYT